MSEFRAGGRATSFETVRHGKSRVTAPDRPGAVQIDRQLVVGTPLATARPTDTAKAPAARGAAGVVGLWRQQNGERRTRRRDKGHSVAWWRHANLPTPTELAVGFG